MNFKKIFAGITAIVVCVSLSTFVMTTESNVFDFDRAEAKTDTNGNSYEEYIDKQNLMYQIYSDHAVVSDTLGTDIKKADIPSSIKGVPITEIGKFAFNRTHITSIVIPDTVTTIAKFAFLDCYSLTTIVVPSSVTSIDTEAFGSKNLTDVYYTGTEEQWGKIKDYEGNPLGDSNNILSIFRYEEGSLEDFEVKFANPTIHYNYQIPVAVTTAATTTSYTPTSTFVSSTKPNSVTSIENSTFATDFSETSAILTETTTNKTQSESTYANKNANQKEISTKPNSVTTTENSTFATDFSETSAILTETTINITQSESTYAITTSKQKETSKKTFENKPKSTTTETLPKPVPTEIYGISIFISQSDVNSDGNIDAKDAALVLTDYANVLLGERAKLDNSTADSNGDGIVDAKDASLILIYYANKMIE